MPARRSIVVRLCYTVLMTTYGYSRVSTSEQGASGLGLDAQAATIQQAASARGLEVGELFTDVASGASRKRRPQLEAVLAVLESGDVLIAARLDRLSRSVSDLSGIADLASAGGWSLVLCDVNVDTSTGSGRFVLHALSAVSELERALVSERTKAALAIARERGTLLGRPQLISDETRQLISKLRNSGMSWRAVSAELERLSVPTATGGTRWYAATARRMAA